MKFKQVLRIVGVFLIIYLIPSVLFSDNVKEADRQYRQLNYRYALEIYEEVMKSNPSLEVAQKIANCYRFINNTEASEVWYKKVIAYPTAGADNYEYLADALKQNGKFDEAASHYLLWGQKKSNKLREAKIQANICETAKVWSENPDIGAKVENEIGFNSENSDFSPVHFGRDMLFISDRWQKNKKEEPIYGWTGNPYLKIYEASLAAKEIKILKGVINKYFHSGALAVYNSLDTIIFTRAVMPASKKQKAGDIGKQYLLVAVKKNGEWVSKEKLPFNEGGMYSVQHPALSPDSKVLYFASDMPGGYGGMDLYYAEKLPNGVWTKPINCGAAINTSWDDVFPVVRKDGKFYFASKGHIGMGGLDIFSAVGERNNFSAVENLRAPTNSSKDDFGILFNEDLKTGFLSSNRIGGVGLDDIYSFTIGSKTEPIKNQVYVVDGTAIEKGTNIAISGLEVVLINKSNGKEAKVFTNEKGKFSFTLEMGFDYSVRGNQNQYFTSQSGDISTKNVKESTVYDVKFELERSKEAFTIRLNNIFYDFNKWDIRPDAVTDLNKVQEFLRRMPSVGMQLVAHTDARGAAAYNMLLSGKRAKSAMQYLVAKGVTADRLTALGKGEMELFNECGEGIKCAEAQHQLNRRAEFKIVKVSPVLATNNLKRNLVK